MLLLPAISFAWVWVILFCLVIWGCGFGPKVDFSSSLVSWDSWSLRVASDGTHDAGKSGYEKVSGMVVSEKTCSLSGFNGRRLGIELDLEFLQLLCQFFLQTSWSAAISRTNGSVGKMVCKTCSFYQPAKMLSSSIFWNQIKETFTH